MIPVSSGSTFNNGTSSRFQTASYGSSRVRQSRLVLARGVVADCSIRLPERTEIPALAVDCSPCWRCCNTAPLVAG